MSRYIRLFSPIPLLLAVGAANASPGTGTIAFVPTSPIPVLSAPMFVLLGILMMVVAFRVFRASSNDMNRLAGAVLFAGGLVLSNYNMSSSVASGLITIMGGACNSGGIAAINVVVGFNGSFENNCPNNLLITDISISCPSVVVNGTCMVNNIVPAGGSCTTPYCDSGGM